MYVCTKKQSRHIAFSPWLKCGLFCGDVDVYKTQMDLKTYFSQSAALWCTEYIHYISTINYINFKCHLLLFRLLLILFVFKGTVAPDFSVSFLQV